jgi:hypothetical protein
MQAEVPTNGLKGIVMMHPASPTSSLSPLYLRLGSQERADEVTCQPLSEEKGCSD